MQDCGARMRACHEEIIARHDRFAALSRQQREEAYQIVRAKNGRGTIHIDEMLAALGMI